MYFILRFQVYNPIASDAPDTTFYFDYYDKIIMARYFKVELDSTSLSTSGICLSFELIGCRLSGKYFQLFYIILFFLRNLLIQMPCSHLLDLLLINVNQMLKEIMVEILFSSETFALTLST